MNDSGTNQIDFPRRMMALNAESTAKLGYCWSMVDSELESLLARRGSFVPVLGDIVWELPKELAAAVPFSAHICQVSGGRQIGYVRVPHYKYDEHAVAEFEKLVARFESTTAALVLDQVNNPGGSMFHMYSMLSTLTDRALALPKHQISIDDDDVAMASDTVALAEAGEEVPPDERPSPELVDYSRFVLSEVEAGRGMGHGPSNPVYLNGVAEVLPAENPYTKTIVVLINELDFSAAEFLAAILQDNKKATLFGERTAGAGGCVKQVTYADPTMYQLSAQFGIAAITVSSTLAWRTNGQPIEEKGVTPDVRYSITEHDIRSGYDGYREALLATINATSNAHSR